jgi:hypothetical protein
VCLEHLWIKASEKFIFNCVEFFIGVESGWGLFKVSEDGDFNGMRYGEGMNFL